MIVACINFIAIFFLTFFIGAKKNYKNLLISISISFFVVLEFLSFLYLQNEVDEAFLFFLFNIQIFHIAVSTKILMTYFILIIFVFLVSIIYLILTKFQIKQYKKIFIIFFIITLFSPIGFLYKIFYVFSVNYGKDYIKYRNYTYQDIFKEVKNIKYITKNELKILNKNQKHKNLILIYLESFDQSYLTNKSISKYTTDINNFSKNGEYYKNIEQLNGGMGTLAGIVSSQCGLQYLSYFIFFNPYNILNKNYQLVCLPDILNKAGYKQIFIGGADKKLFNKGNYLLSHMYDIVEDKDSLTKKYPKLKNNLVSWGVPDYDLFKLAKNEYIKLSKSNQQFNMTILTTSTHNTNGVYDKRCKNTTNNNLLNSIECTNSLLKDFIEFIKKQKNYENTIIAILPDHIQYNYNTLKNKINENEKKLYLILLNTGKNKIYDNKINYTDISKILLQKLNIKSNANFLNEQKDEISKNFIHKIHK